MHSVNRVRSYWHGCSQLFSGGALFFAEKVDDLFSVLHVLPGGVLTTFPRKFGPKILFCAVGVHPLATPGSYGCSAYPVIEHISCS